MSIVFIPVLVWLIGLLMYMLSAPGSKVTEVTEVTEVGRLMFGSGLLVTLYAIITKALHF